MGSPCIEYIRHFSLRDENQELGQTRGGHEVKEGCCANFVPSYRRQTLYRDFGVTHYTVSGEMGFFETGRESIVGEHNTISDQRGLLYWAENCDACTLECSAR